MQLFERITRAAELVEGSRAKMAKTMAKVLGINQRTFEGYFSPDREKNLWPILPEILRQYPSLERSWLYFGEGPMLIHHDYPPDLTAENSNGRLTGDLLDAALSFSHIQKEEILNKTTIDELTLDSLLASRIKPTFDHLEQLYLKFGINPSYFFDGNENTMVIPSDPLLRIFYILGKHGFEPHKDDVIEIFDAEKEEATQFIKEWREYRRQGRQRVIPPKWIDKFIEKCKVTYSLIVDLNPPFAEIPRQKYIPVSNTASASKDSYLEFVIAKLKEVNASDETIEKAIMAIVCRDNNGNDVAHHSAAGNE